MMCTASASSPTSRPGRASPMVLTFVLAFCCMSCPCAAFGVSFPWLFRFAFVVCGLFEAWVTSSWSVGNLMGGDTVQELSEQDFCPGTLADHERSMHRQKFAEGILETLSQRLAALLP